MRCMAAHLQENCADEELHAIKSWYQPLLRLWPMRSRKTELPLSTS